MSTATNGIATMKDCNNKVSGLFPSASADTGLCPTQAQISSAKTQTSYLTISGSYATNQLVKYSDLTTRYHSWDSQVYVGWTPVTGNYTLCGYSASLYSGTMSYTAFTTWANTNITRDFFYFTEMRSSSDLGKYVGFMELQENPGNYTWKVGYYYFFLSPGGGTNYLMYFYLNLSDVTNLNIGKSITSLRTPTSNVINLNF